ncbi:prohead protease/major capsid protein fusion protein [Histidinibacterium lentulum]|uniref:Peptidase U35 n=1 Tax=Histidinibacterium lentulum TaxID=2480588 RepID=A0A3N2QV16_9RHOB|nr:prohead protease/major capsid protein fusion protein [Histidinibacterium lentulum]ROT99078.1 peptidase U35 [Histidinibacterium lentulum]
MTVHLRALTTTPSTVNMEARTVEAIVSTGADVVRPGYIERLDPAAAELGRMIGAPVLDAHRTASTRDQLGVIEAAELRPEGIWVRIRFRSNEAAGAVLADIAEGTLRGLSIGYSVAEWKEQTESGQRVRIAKRWTPLEVSVVPVPADPGAHFRAGETSMEAETQTAGTTAATPGATRAQINVEIRQLAETAGLTRDWADEQIDADATVEAARAAAFEAMRQRSAAPTRTTRTQITVDHTDPAVIAQRAGEALYARSHPEHQLSEPARPFAHMSTRDLAQDCLRRAGIPTTGLASDTIITRALHTTSDFSLILGDAVGRELRRAYDAAPAEIMRVARETTHRDFRPKRALQFGEGTGFEEVPEGGEFKHGTFGESEESFALKSYGKIFSITRQALVNDDLSAFSQVPAKLGDEARRFMAGAIAAKLEANPAMADGDAVFHANHGNLAGTGATLSLTSLSGARLAMRRQTGIDGELIGVTPRFVVVSPELETTAEQVLAELAATTSENVNPFSFLELVVEPRLTDPDAWYVAADPARIDGLEYAYLEGAPGPQIETRQGFEVDGVQMKARLDFGCGWVEHRGWFKNEGPAE